MIVVVRKHSLFFFRKGLCTNFFQRKIRGYFRKGVIMLEISSDVIRGYNDTIILFFLRNEPSYGYEISKNIRSLSKEKYLIKETTLYSAFTRLEKNGYISSFSMEAENGKKRTYYRITDEGRKYYQEKCEEWQLTKEVIENFISA